MEEVNPVTTSKPIWIWIVLGVVLICMISAAIWWFSISNNKETTNLLCTDFITKEKLREITGLNIFYFSTNGSNNIITDEPIFNSLNATWCTFAEIKDDFKETDEFFIIPDGNIWILSDISKYDRILTNLRKGKLNAELIREVEDIGEKGYIFKYEGSGVANLNFMDDSTNCYIELNFGMPSDTSLFPSEDSLEENIEKVIAIAKEVDKNLDKTSLDCSS